MKGGGLVGETHCTTSVRLLFMESIENTRKFYARKSTNLKDLRNLNVHEIALITSDTIRNQLDKLLCNLAPLNSMKHWIKRVR